MFEEQQHMLVYPVCILYHFVVVCCSLYSNEYCKFNLDDPEYFLQSLVQEFFHRSSYMSDRK